MTQKSKYIKGKKLLKEFFMNDPNNMTEILGNFFTEIRSVLLGIIGVYTEPIQAFENIKEVMEILLKELYIDLMSLRIKDIENLKLKQF